MLTFRKRGTGQDCRHNAITNNINAKQKQATHLRTKKNKIATMTGPIATAKGVATATEAAPTTTTATSTNNTNQKRQQQQQQQPLRRRRRKQQQQNNTENETQTT